MNRPLALPLILLAAAVGPPAAPAQPPPAKPPTAITLRPASEPRPALKYRLVPPRPTLEPGNAAVFYHRALQLSLAKQRALEDAEPKKPGNPQIARGRSIDEKVGNWINGPLAEIPYDEARALLDQFADTLKEVDQGIRRLDCDWEFDRRTVEGNSLLLPEIQEVRSIARLVSLQARLAIVAGDYDRAVDRARAGLTLARHVARGPFAIQSLVGVAIANEMVDCLRALIQAPGAPSLYWALANRPRPLIDMRDAFDSEHDALENELPGLRELEVGIWGRDQARRFVAELQRKLADLGSGSLPGSLLLGNSAGPPDSIPISIRRLGIAAVCAKVYPEARTALIAAGRPEAEVDAMPVVQVAALHSLREYRQANDDLFKGLDLPYWQLAALPKVAGFESVEAKLANPLWATISILSSDLRRARLAPLRLDRQLDALQCVEAIRLDATTHGGKLPMSLEAIVATPCPVDPATGTPFRYEVAGDSATLDGPIPPGAPDHPTSAIRYALKLAR